MAVKTHQARAPDWARENGRFIPSLAKWLRGNQWDNDFRDQSGCGQGQNVPKYVPPPEKTPEEKAREKAELEKAWEEARKKLGLKAKGGSDP